MKKQTIWLVLFAVLITIISGTVNAQDNMIEITPPYGEVTGEPVEAVWMVAHYTRECVGVAPTTCLLVRESADDEWENFFGNIANFAYIEGSAYELRVMIAELTNVPADASSRFVQMVEILSKQSVNPLIERDWQLVSMNGEEVSAEAGISLVFAEDSSLGGNSGCNTYSTDYKLDDAEISMDVIRVTQRACLDGMEMESAYLETLGQVTGYSLDGSQLMLLNEDGETILSFQSN